MSMARSTPDEIRRRIAKRKRENGTSAKTPERQIYWPGDDEKYEYNYISPSYGSDGDDGHPLFKKEVFFFKILASVLLFLAVAILFRNHSATFEPARTVVLKTMDQDFKFAVVSKWYEDKFGKPLALLPFSDDKKAAEKVEVQKGAVEVSGKILENFEKNGQGIMIETSKGAAVQAINDGFVRFVGEKEGLGKTVIIQHSDQTETWYGNLGTIKVKLYEYIEKSAVVGTVSETSGEDKTKGKYYFAVKKGDQFIDPIKVIRLE
ncbi:peptidoglycan DD-metalloendopeptidase family protein [Neobacillus sp. LXY-1]|uniref:peptidoglycan DD-metalloendopeptidase family protein n=1 Tax=Neobacillus sp. LXY-1 TaxID=3379133 RepID=UPI003EE3EDE9